MGEIYIIFLLMLLGIPAVIGISFLIKNMSERKANRDVRGREAPPPPEPGTRNIDPVTLDRNPHMPHKPGATS